MPPGAILGPQNALDFIGSKGGRRNRAAKSTISMKIRLLHGGKRIFTRVRETFVLPCRGYFVFPCPGPPNGQNGQGLGILAKFHEF